MFPQKEDPMMLLFEALITGNSSNAIENQEKRGQSDFVNSEVLPKKCNGCNRKQLENIGIVFGKDADDIFVYVVLPNGWKKNPTDHSMWSNLVDDKGRKRASIFYKAAFYDRDAHISLDHRFSYEVRPVGGWGKGDEKYWQAIVTDGNEILWKGKEFGPKPDYSNRELSLKWMDEKDKMGQQAESWLKQKYPDWQNVLAYWDL